MKQIVIFTTLILLSVVGYCQAPTYNPTDKLYYTKKGKLFSGLVYYPRGEIYGAIMDSTNTTYINGKITLSESFYLTDTVKSQFIVNGDTSLYVSFYDNGNVKAKSKKVNKKHIDIDTSWYKSGIVSALKTYHGDSILYQGFHENAARIYLYKKVKRKLYGDNTSWFDDGGIKLQQTNIAVPNKKQESREFYKNGILHKQSIQIDKQDASKKRELYYTKNGILSKEELWQSDTIVERIIYNTQVDCIIEKENISPDSIPNYQELLEYK